MMRSFCKKTPKWSYKPKDTNRSFRGQFTSIADQLFYGPLFACIARASVGLSSPMAYGPRLSIG